MEITNPIPSIFALTEQLHYTAGVASGYGALCHPVVIDGSKQGDNLKYTSWRRPSISGDLSNPTDFNVCLTSSSVMWPSRPAASVAWEEFSPGSLEKSITTYYRNSLRMASLWSLGRASMMLQDQKHVKTPRISLTRRSCALWAWLKWLYI